MTYQRRVYIPLEYVFTLPNLTWQDDIVKDIAFTFSTATAKSKKTKFGVIALASSDNTLVAIDVVDTQESWFVADKNGDIQIKEGKEQIRYLDDKFWVSRDAKGCLRVWAHGATCSTLALTVGYPGEKGINRVMEFIESKSYKGNIT